jgi:LCP family protein required for cell wall assembly
MYVLIVGKDTQSADYTDGFADVIRIARIDFRVPSVLLLSIPRDMVVRIQGLEAHGIVEERLRSAYALGYAYNIPGGGISLLAQTLISNFGVHIDHYAVANFYAFARGIDAVGGVDIDVAAGATGFRQGMQHMNGWQALYYARLRETAVNPSDLARIDRQSQLIRAIRAEILSSEILPKVPQLAKSLRDSVLTDMSPSQITSLICAGRLTGKENFAGVSIPAALFTRQLDSRNHELLNPDYPGLREFIRQFNQDTLPSLSAPPE